MQVLKLNTARAANGIGPGGFNVCEYVEARDIRQPRKREPENTAQRLVQFSVDIGRDPKFAAHVDWSMVTVGFGAVRAHQFTRVYRFADGSAVVLTGERGLPVEFIG